MNLMLLDRLLKQCGFTNVKCVLSGAEALHEVFESGRSYDVVLLDVMMPEMDGFEVCRRIRRRLSAVELPIIHVTADTVQRNMMFGLANGANDWLSKPFTAPMLLPRMRPLLTVRKTWQRMMQQQQRQPA